jgi:type I restriction enzyme S subunit
MTWRRAKIGDLCQIVKGETGLASAPPGPYPLVATSADRRSCTTWQFDADAVCIPLVSSTGHGKKTLNYVHYQSGKFALGTILAAVIPKDPTVLTARFLHLYLSHFKDTVLVPLMKGAANVSLPMKEIAAVEIPVPPLVEQQNLMDLIFRIEDEHQELLDETNHQGNLLKKLRQSVLQEAVEGKLTAEWRRQNVGTQNVGTQNIASLQRHGNPLYDAVALLAQIKTEKEQMAKDGKICGSSHRRDAKYCVSTMSPVADKDKPFDLPEGWVWCRLGSDLAIVGTGATPQTSNSFYYQNGTIDWITSSATNHPIVTQAEKKITEKALLETNYKVFPVGTLIVAMYGQGKTRGQITELGIPAATNQACAALLLHDSSESHKKYVTLCFQKQYEEIRCLASGGSQPNLNMEKIKATAIPLPPLAEQQAIVTRVDSLMATIDALEKQRVETQNLASLLMQTVLREAFDEN